MRYKYVNRDFLLASLAHQLSRLHDLLGANGTLVARDLLTRPLQLQQLLDGKRLLPIASCLCRRHRRRLVPGNFGIGSPGPSSGIVIVSDHMITQVFETAETFVTNFAGEDRVDRALCCSGRWGIVVLPRGYLIMGNDFFVMLSCLHVFGQQIQGPKTLTTSHAFENVPGLLISTPDPNILATNKFPWNGHLLSQHISVMTTGRG